MSRSEVDEQMANFSPSGGANIQVLPTTTISVTRSANQQTAEESVCLAFVEPTHVVAITFYRAKQLRFLIDQVQATLRDFHDGGEDDDP